MMRASLCAMAVTALGAPSLLRRRRKQSPRAESLFSNALADIRNADARRLAFFPVLVLNTLPPLISGLGDSLSQLAKAEALRKSRRFGPTSVTKTCRN